MHRAALAAAGLQDWSYQRLPVPPELFAETARALGAAGFRGANVTIPHKEAALAIADDASDTARAIGAANTLTYGDDGAIHADNTDAPGLLDAIEGRPRETAVVLGAGGSARAVVWALLTSGTHVQVWNRTPERAAQARRRGPARRRAHPGGRPARQLHERRSRRSVQDFQATADFSRCDGHVPDGGGPGLPARRNGTRARSA